MSLAPLLSAFRTFYRHAGIRLPLLICIIVVGGLLESVGVGLFIPLLSLGGPTPTDDPVTGVITNFFALLGRSPTLGGLLALLLAVAFVKGAVSVIQAVLTSRITAGLTYDLRERLVQLLGQTTFRNYLGFRTGFLTNVISTESDRAVASFGHFSNTLASIIYVFAYTVLALIIDPEAALVVTFAGLVAVSLIGILHRSSRHYSLLTSDRNARLHDLLIQTIHAFKYLRSTNGFPALSRKLASELRSLADYTFRLGVLGGVLKSATEPVGAVVLVGLLYVNVFLGGAPLADMLVLALVFYRLTSKLIATQSNWQKYNATIGGLDAFQRTFEELSRDVEAFGHRRVERLEEGIWLQGVSFSFGDRPILRDVSLRIRRNTTVALVGSTGAGKSTVVNLVTGLLSPTSGAVFIDGVDYREVDTRSLRSLIGYVTQETIIFHDTLANNIAFWRCRPEEPECADRVRQAASQAHADSFIASTESGFDTVLGDRGSTISGGQRQQVALARELFKDPEILILDEAMSALDAHTEWAIQQGLAELKGRKTILVVTHRLASVKACDYVYVLKDGEVVEEGTFEMLNGDSDSVFRGLASLQSL